MFRINKTFIKYSLLFYWLLILVLTSFPADTIPQPGISDKIAHFAAYFGLSVLAFLFWENNNVSLSVSKYELKILLILAAYGLFDEIHQIFIPGRSCEFLDFVADLSGTLIGYIFIKVILNKRVIILRKKK